MVAVVSGRLDVDGGRRFPPVGEPLNGRARKAQAGDGRGRVAEEPPPGDPNGDLGGGRVGRIGWVWKASDIVGRNRPRWAR